MSDLDVRVRDRRAAEVSPERVDAVWNGLTSRRTERKRHSTRPVALLAAVALAVAAALVVVFGTGPGRAQPGPLHLSTGGELPAAVENAGERDTLLERRSC